MRARKEIETDALDRNMQSSVHNQALMLEVLLDIRDLLEKDTYHIAVSPLAIGYPPKNTSDYEITSDE